MFVFLLTFFICSLIYPFLLSFDSVALGDYLMKSPLYIKCVVFLRFDVIRFGIMPQHVNMVCGKHRIAPVTSEPMVGEQWDQSFDGNLMEQYKHEF